MHIRPEQLRANLEALDSEALRARLRAGKLTEAAREIANAVLVARGEPGENPAVAPSLLAEVERNAPPVAKPLPGRPLALAALWLYVGLAILCTVVVFADPPWASPQGGSWKGMIGTLAAVTAGLPWTYVYLSGFMASNSVGVLIAVAALGVAVNLSLLAMYLRRT